ncbi:MAG: hypothetical protein RL156_215 [Bacteroidota bacterium]|jgi:hypothetical protein
MASEFNSPTQPSDEHRERPRAFLATEDYDNIWLRIKDKGIRWVLTWVTFIVTLITIIIATITFLGFNNYVQEKALSLTRTYVSSTEFKKEASDSLSSFLLLNRELISDLQAKLRMLKDSVRLVSNLRNAPYSFGSNSASFVDSLGTQFRIEYGNASTDDPVEFRESFLDPPLVYMTATTQLTQLVGQRTEKQIAKTSNHYPLVLDSVSRTGFVVKMDPRYTPWGFSGSQNFNWIAIGH